MVKKWITGRKKLLGLCPLYLEPVSAVLKKNVTMSVI